METKNQEFETSTNMKLKPVLTIDEKGSKNWKIGDIYHREDGPAFETSTGYRIWFKHNKRHRTNGPAVEFSNGTNEFWINGKYYTELEWKQKIRKLKLDKILK